MEHEEKTAMNADSFMNFIWGKIVGGTWRGYITNFYFTLCGVPAGELLRALLTGQWWPWYAWASAVAVLLVLGILLFWWHYKYRPRYHMRADITIDRSEQEIAQNARRGLIALVSMYTPQHGSAAYPLSPEERNQALELRDYKKLDIRNSNLAPLLKAIESHQSQLQYCWLISTLSSQSHQGSDRSARLVEQYFKDQGLSCQFFHESIPQEDDALLLRKVKELVERLLQGAVQDYGLSEKEIICDCTGAIRAMQLGVVFACLDAERDVQLMGTHYDAAGRPRGELFRIRIHFEPDLRLVSA